MVTATDMGSWTSSRSSTPGKKNEAGLFARFYSRVRAYLLPEPDSYGIRMPDGKTLHHVSNRAWRRNSAFLTEYYEHEKRARIADSLADKLTTDIRTAELNNVVTIRPKPIWDLSDTEYGLIAVDLTANGPGRFGATSAGSSSK